MYSYSSCPEDETICLSSSLGSYGISALDSKGLKSVGGSWVDEFGFGGMCPAARTRAWADLMEWAQKRIPKEAVRKADGLYKSMDVIRATGAGADLGMWLQLFASPGEVGIAEVMREKGIPEINMTNPLLKAAVRDLGLTKNPNEKIPWTTLLNLFLDECELAKRNNGERVAASRATWFLKTYMLDKVRGLTQLAPPKTSALPKKVTADIVKWLMDSAKAIDAVATAVTHRPVPMAQSKQGFAAMAPMARAIFISPTNESAAQSRPGFSTSRSSGTSSPTPSSMSAAADAKDREALAERWIRAASFVRWMYEEGLLRNLLLFQELLNMMKAVLLDPNASSVTQSLITNEVLSYASEAVKGQVQHIFHDACSDILRAARGREESVRKSGDAISLKESALFNNNGRAPARLQGAPTQSFGAAPMPSVPIPASIVKLLEACASMCKASLHVAVKDIIEESDREMVWIDNYVGLFWEAESCIQAVISLIAEDMEADSTVSFDPIRVLKRNGFLDLPTGCSALLEWAVSSTTKRLSGGGGENADDSALVGEVVEMVAAGMACAIRAESNALDAYSVFAFFIDGLVSSPDVEEECISRSLLTLAFIVSSLAARGLVAPSIWLQNTKDRASSAPNSAGILGMFAVLSNVDSANLGVKNEAFRRSKLQKPLCDFDVTEIVQNWSNRNFAIESNELVDTVSKIHPITTRIRIVSWLIECAPLAIVNLAVVRLFETETLRCGMWHEASLDENSIIKKLHRVIEKRAKVIETTTTAHEARRLRECFSSFSSLSSSPLSPIVRAAARASSPVNLSMLPINAHVSKRPVQNMMLQVTSEEKNTTPPAALAAASGFHPNKDDIKGIIGFSPNCLNLKGVEGENMRYKEGLERANMPAKTLAGLILTNGGSVDVFRDLISCRSRDDREDLIRWCLENNAYAPDEMIKSGLCTVEHVLWYWNDRKIVLQASLVSSCLRVKEFRRHAVCCKVPSIFLKFASNLLTISVQDETMKPFYDEFFSLVAPYWVSRGPSWLSLHLNSVEEPRVKAALQEQYLKLNANVSIASAVTSDWNTSMFGWFSIVAPPTSDEFVRSLMNHPTVESVDAMAARLASIAVVHGIQDVIVTAARADFDTMVSSSTMSSPNFRASKLVARCVRRASEPLREMFAESLAKAILSKPWDLSKMLLSCLFKGKPLKDSRMALNVVKKIDCESNKTLFFLLVRQCASEYQRELVEIMERLENPNCRLVIRYFLHTCISDSNEVQAAENLRVVGERSLSSQEPFFVDAWTVFHGAKESEAQYHMLKGTVLR